MKYLLTLLLLVLLYTCASAQHTIVIHHKYYTSLFDTVQRAGLVNDYWQTQEHAANHKAVDRKTMKDFTSDPLVPERFQLATRQDYRYWNSRHPEEKYDVGHIVPYSAMGFDIQAATETMYFDSNTMPQSSDFNEGVWMRVEKLVLDSIAPLYDSVHVWTGVLISTSHPKYMDAICIPDYYWKVAGYNSAPGERTYIAWLGKNVNTPKTVKPAAIIIKLAKLRSIIQSYYPQLVIPF